MEGHKLEMSHWNAALSQSDFCLQRAPRGKWLMLFQSSQILLFKLSAQAFQNKQSGIIRNHFLLSNVPHVIWKMHQSSISLFLSLSKILFDVSIIILTRHVLSRSFRKHVTVTHTMRSHASQSLTWQFGLILYYFLLNYYD